MSTQTNLAEALAKPGDAALRHYLENISPSTFRNDVLELCTKLAGTIPVSEPTTPRLANVRVAVVVDSDGDWNATGWNSRLEKSQDKIDAEMAELAREGVGDHEVVYFLNAQVPIPAKAVEVNLAPCAVEPQA